MKTCQSCGRSLPDYAKFCSGCGSDNLDKSEIDKIKKRNSELERDADSLTKRLKVAEDEKKSSENEKWKLLAEKKTLESEKKALVAEKKAALANSRAAAGKSELSRAMLVPFCVLMAMAFTGLARASDYFLVHNRTGVMVTFYALTTAFSALFFTFAVAGRLRAAAIVAAIGAGSFAAVASAGMAGLTLGFAAKFLGISLALAAGAFAVSSVARGKGVPMLLFIALMITVALSELPQLVKKFLPDGGFAEILVEMVEVEGGRLTLFGYNNQISTFSMSRTEVTQKLYKQVTGENPSSQTESELLPVTDVSWLDAVKFCNLLSEKSGLEKCYEIGENSVSVDMKKNGFRLPTKCEWLFAATDGTSSSKFKYSGSDDFEKVAWLSENSDIKTHEVGKKEGNALGIFDMSGNVAEFVWDWAKDEKSTYYYSRQTLPDPTGPESGKLRLCMGGTYGTPASTTLDMGWTLAPEASFNNTGIRLVRRK